MNSLSVALVALWNDYQTHSLSPEYIVGKGRYSDQDRTAKSGLHFHEGFLVDPTNLNIVAPNHYTCI